MLNCEDTMTLNGFRSIFDSGSSLRKLGVLGNSKFLLNLSETAVCAS